MGRLASRLLAVLALGLLAPRRPAAADPELVIGVLLPMSGDNATFGEESWNGIKIAEKEIRAKDPSFAFKLVLADEQSKREQVGPQTKQLIENHGAAIVVGSVASSNTMQAAIVCKEAGDPAPDPRVDERQAHRRDRQVRGGRVPRLLQGLLPGHHARPLRVEHAEGEEGRRRSSTRARPTASGLAAQFEKEFVRARRHRRDRVLHLDRQGLHDAGPEGRRAGKPDVILISGYYPQAGPMIRLGEGRPGRASPSSAATASTRPTCSRSPARRDAQDLLLDPLRGDRHRPRWCRTS